MAAFFLSFRTVFGDKLDLWSDRFYTNFMKKTVFFLFLAVLLTGFGLSAQTRQEWNSLVDFDMTLQELSQAVRNGDESLLQSGKLFVLRGSVEERRVVNVDRESYQAELKIASGEWISLAEVEMFSALVILSGPEFFNYVPARRSRKTHPDEISTNSDVLVVGRLAGVIERKGVKLPVIDCFQLRVLK